MKRRRFLPLKMCTPYRIMGAAAIGLAIASSAAAVPVQITGLSMTVSAVDPAGSWVLQGDNLLAFGIFGDEFPSLYVNPPLPITPGQTVQDVYGDHGFGAMGWRVDPEDGFSGTRIFNGVKTPLGGADDNSLMQVTANDIVVNHVGVYTEPFTYSARLCAPIEPPNPDPCPMQADVLDTGTLDMVIVPYGHLPGLLEIQSISYTIGRITESPEPGTLSLLALALAGVAVLGRRRRSRELLPAG